MALVSQSGGIGHNAFMPLMNHRRLGFSYVISCGNAIRHPVEDYVSHFVDDPDVEVIAGIIETLTKPRLLFEAAQRARALSQVDRDVPAGPLDGRAGDGPLPHRRACRATTQSWRLPSPLRHCAGRHLRHLCRSGRIVCVGRRGRHAWRQDVIVVSGSGGGAAVAADALDSAGVSSRRWPRQTIERIGATLPEFGSVTNPLDGTGSIYDDPAMLPALMEAHPGTIPATPPSRAPSTRVRAPNRCAVLPAFSPTPQTSGRTVVAYQPSPLGAALDPDIVSTLNDGGVPLLLGISEAMRSLDASSPGRNSGAGKRRCFRRCPGCRVGAADGCLHGLREVLSRRGCPLSRRGSSPPNGRPSRPRARWACRSRSRPKRPTCCTSPTSASSKHRHQRGRVRHRHVARCHVPVDSVLGNTVAVVLIPFVGNLRSDWPPIPIIVGALGSGLLWYGYLYSIITTCRWRSPFDPDVGRGVSGLQRDLPELYPEMFPARTRVSAVAIAQNIGTVITSFLPLLYAAITTIDSNVPLIVGGFTHGVRHHLRRRGLLLAGDVHGSDRGAGRGARPACPPRGVRQAPRTRSGGSNDDQ